MKALLLGIGLALIPVYRMDMAIQMLGLSLVILATALILLRDRITIPRNPLTIALLGLATLQVITGTNEVARILPMIMFAVYIAAANSGSKITTPLGIMSIVGGLSIIVLNIASASRTGGLYHPENYNIAIGAILLGAILWNHKYQWIVLLMAFTAVIASGAEEGLIAAGILVVAILVRRDWSIRTLMPMSILVLVALAIIFNFPTLWSSLDERIDSIQAGEYNAALTGRWDGYNGGIGYKAAVTDINWLGHGYKPNGASEKSIHNVPLIALYQTGILGIGLWLFILGYGVFKTKMRYAFIMLFALSLFDNYLWTQIMPYTWATAGIAATVTKEDFIFRRA